MADTLLVSDALRQRLQLALGTRAMLAAEIPGADGRRAFRAAHDGEVAVVVTVHRAPPGGPTVEMMHDRIDRLRQLGHDIIDVPLGDGDLDGHVWVMEADPTLPSVRDRLARGPLPLAHGVSVIRDLTRALAAMHRRGITHGAIDLQTIRIGDGLRICGLGQAVGGSVREDIDALGRVAWSLLSGEPDGDPARPLSAIRRGVAPGLDLLFVALRAPDPHDRPQGAQDILEALDAVPTRRSNSLASIVDGGMHDGRPRRGLVWLVVGGAVLLLLALLQLRA
jgi:hypothetical protein